MNGAGDQGLRRGRVLALVAVAAALAGTVLVVVGLASNLLRSLLIVALVALALVALWFSLTRRGPARVVAVVGLGAALVGVLVVVLTGDNRGVLLAGMVALWAVAGAATRAALDAAAAGVEIHPRRVEPARRGVLVVNLRSGGGKAERLRLADRARELGVEVVVLSPGDDLRQLAEDAVARGADVLGMAGGDGSQALVAHVAARHGIPFVCVPAGTRNHLALDLGLDRQDVAGALDAFGEARERTIDLAAVNGMVFVNNVSLGVYARIVQAPEYRDAKGRTARAMLPDLLGPAADSFDLHFEDALGVTHDHAQVIQVSNNPYRLRPFGGFGSRARMDTGLLGIAALELRSDADVARFVAMEATGRVDGFEGWLEWAAPSFELRSDAPVEAGVDGESMVLDPPLVFEAWPSALRVRLPLGAPGASPAARRQRSLLALLRGRERDHPLEETNG